MEKDKIQHFKQKLIRERERAINLINEMKENELVNTNIESTRELSFYDNHPSDLASEIVELEKGLALKGNEMSILGKINDALSSIEHHTYGRCKSCGKDIMEERLEVVPYARYCLSCKETEERSKPAEQNNRSVEEDVLGIPFRHSDRSEVGIDAEDTYQVLDAFNRVEDQIGYYNDDDDDNGYVEPIEKISNEQYRNQLPD